MLDLPVVLILDNPEFLMLYELERTIHAEKKQKNDKRLLTPKAAAEPVIFISSATNWLLYGLHKRQRSARMRSTKSKEPMYSRSPFSKSMRDILDLRG